jgi:BirA family transcriptional regulator, biotin operon repressor / biotin---[acetyl-CoA-carboxylase] ligase
MKTAQKKATKKTAHIPGARRRKLLSLLASGESRSGEDLARELRVTRSAVWKLIGKLRALGVDIQALPRQGYHLPHAVDLYDANEIQRNLSASARLTEPTIEVLLNIDSTNRYLIDAAPLPAGQPAICVTELQTAGRGRRGRSWLAPFGSGVCLSLAWQFSESPPTFSSLSLVVGLSVVRAMERFGAKDVQLKWPNDVVFKQRKLAGILIEMRGEAGGPSRVVIGLGVNLQLPTATRMALAEQQALLVTDLRDVLHEQTPNRNTLVAAVVDELLASLRQFEREGFSAFAEEWRNRDSLMNAQVRVLSANETISGIARGVTTDGALLVEVDGKTQRFMSGDVSLRPA